MTKDEDFKLLKIQTCVLRVNIDCDGCKQKVKKLLQRTEGVYKVDIDAEQQKVTVLGGVDPATLIRKLFRAGKHAELWSQKSNQIQKQKANCIKDDKGNKGQKQGQVRGLEALKNQQNFPFNLEEDEGYMFEDEEEDAEEDELRFMREKANHMNLLRQRAAAMQANNAKKGVGAEMAAAAAAANNGKMNNNVGNGSAGKKGNHHHPPNQNMGMKVHPVGIDQKTLQALKMNNGHFGVVGANVNPGEGGKKGNDINSVMNLAGFNGNGAANNFGSVLGAGHPGNAAAGVYPQVQNNGGFMGSPAGIPNGGMTASHHPAAMMMNMNGGYQQQYHHNQNQNQNQNHPASSMSMLMSLQNRHGMQQPQMMYNRSPFIPPSTGYYYSYGPPPPVSTYHMLSSEASYYGNPSGDHHIPSATSEMFSDENTSSCSIM